MRDSPLLRTPTEVFNKILRYAVGDSLIHIKYICQFYYYPGTPILYPKGGLRAAFCTAGESESHASEAVVANSFAVPASADSNYYIPPCKERHQGCTMVRNGPTSILPEERERLKVDLAILGTCRQIYEEAHVVLWCTNTFSFDDGISFRLFVDALNTVQRQKLKHIHMSINVEIDQPTNQVRDTTEVTQWKQKITATTVQKLKGLRHLHLCIEQYSLTRPSFLASHDTDEESIDSVLRQMKPFFHFQSLPLDQVTVIISDDIAPEEGPFADRWTKATKLTIASEIKDKIANPLGADVAKAEKEAKRQEIEHKKVEKDAQRQRNERKKAEDQRTYILVRARIAQKAQARLDQALLDISMRQEQILHRGEKLGAAKSTKERRNWKRVLDEASASLARLEESVPDLQEKARVMRKVAEIVAADPTVKHMKALAQAEGRIPEKLPERALMFIHPSTWVGS